MKKERNQCWSKFKLFNQSWGKIENRFPLVALLLYKIWEYHTNNNKNNKRQSKLSSGHPIWFAIIFIKLVITISINFQAFPDILAIFFHFHSCPANSSPYKPSQAMCGHFFVWPFLTFFQPFLAIYGSPWPFQAHPSHFCKRHFHIFNDIHNHFQPC